MNVYIPLSVSLSLSIYIYMYLYTHILSEQQQSTVNLRCLYHTHPNSNERIVNIGKGH